MTLVRNQVTDAAGHPTTGHVIIRLVGSNLRPTTTSEVIADTSLDTGLDGSWQIDLPANTAEAPYYIVTEQATRKQIIQHIIQVPASTQPLWLGDLVVVLPQPVTEFGSIFQGPPGPPGPPGDPGSGGGTSSPALVYGVNVDASNLPDGTLIADGFVDPS